MSYSVTDSLHKISVIITCYNEGNYLLKAVESVREQTDQDFEFFVINDCSPNEETNRICRALETDENLNIFWLKENLGLSGARNFGFEQMRGEIAVFLDADDILPPNAVSDARKCFTDYPDADFIYGDYIRINKGNQKRFISLKDFTNPDNTLNREAIVKKWVILGQSPCKKSAWAKVNGYDAVNFRNKANDWDFFLRMLMKDVKGYYTGTIMYHWYYRPGSMTTEITSFHNYKIWTRNFEVFERFTGKELIRNLIVLYHIENYDYENAKKFTEKFKGYISLRNRIKVEMLRFGGLFKLAKKIVFSTRKMLGKK